MKASASEENERETVIHILADKVSIFTGSLPMFHKLTKLGYKEISSADHYAWLEGPAKGITFRRANAQKRGRVMTEEEKKAVSERFKKARLSRVAS